MSESTKITPSGDAEDLLEAFRTATREAVENAFSKGLPVTGRVNGQLCKVYPDGWVEIISSYSPQEQEGE